jgi:hypothetical protein
MKAGDQKLPEAVQRVLVEAAADPEFCEALLARRLEAADARGHALNPSERAMLQSVPDPQLRAVIDGLRGIGADLPAPAEVIPFAEPAGIRPDDPVVKGIRPTRLLIGAAVTTAALGGAAYWLLAAGSRPEPPAVEEVARPPADAGGDAVKEGK